MADAKTTLEIEVAAKDETTKVLKGVESSIIRFVGAVSSILTTISVVVFPIKQAADFQRELLNVQKTTEFTTDGIDRLSESLKEMSQRLNISALDLAKVAAAGGQLGLGKQGGVEGLIAYTETTARFASVLDVSVEEAGTAIGKLSNLFNIAISDAERISSTLNEVSNNSTASGRELIDIIQRIGTAGATLTLQQSAALAAYGKDLGLTSETVGTTLNKVFLDLQTKAEQVAPLVGMTVTEFANLVKTDGIAAFKLYVGALSQMGNVARNTISEQITGGGRIAAFITAAVNDARNNFSLLSKDMEAANKGFTTGTSAIQEQARVLSGFSAQLQILKNVLSNLGETIGREALPYLTELAKGLQNFLKDQDVVDFFKGITSQLGELTTALVSVVKYLAGIGPLVGPLLTAVKYFAYFKIAEWLLTGAAALVKFGTSAVGATAGLRGLANINRDVIRNTAASATALQAQNAALTEQGKAVTTQVGRIGLAAQAATRFFSPLWDAQKLQAQREGDLNSAIASRDKMLGSVLSKLREIRAVTAATAQKAYDDVIAAGGTKKAASTAKRDSRNQSNWMYDKIDVAATNRLIQYNAEIDKLAERQKFAAISANAMGGSIQFALATVVNSARTAAMAVMAVGQSFLIGASQILFFVSIASTILDAFGWLDPVINSLKKLFGIRTAADQEQNRASADKAKRDQDELKRIRELSGEYDKLASNWEKTLPEGGAGGTAELVRRLDLVHAKMSSMSLEAATVAGRFAYAGTQVQSLEAQLSLAKDRLNELKAGSVFDRDQALRSMAPALLLSAMEKSDPRKNILAAQRDVEMLTEKLRLANTAKNALYSRDTKAYAEAGKLQERENELIQRLSGSYNSEGMEILKVLQARLNKQKELEKATERLTTATARGFDTSTVEKDAKEYNEASLQVQALEAEVAGLDDTYRAMRSSASLAANAFVVATGVDESTASIGRLNSIIRLFNNLSSGTSTESLAQELADARKAAEDTEVALFKLEKQRAGRARGIDILRKDGTLSAKDAADEERKLNDAAATQSAILSEKLAKQKAMVDALERETKAANTLKEAYRNGGTEAERTARQNEAATKEVLGAMVRLPLLRLALEGQRRMVAAAESYVARMKSKHEEALQAIKRAVDGVVQEMRELDTLFATRRLSIRLSVFDKDTERMERVFRDIQDENLAAERKRLEQLGLSSEEVERQMKMYQRMTEMQADMRKEAVESQRQGIVISDIEADITKSREAALEASRQAEALRLKAKEAQKVGDVANFIEYGRQAAIFAQEAQIELDALTKKVAEYKTEASKTVATPFGAKVLRSDDQIRDTVRAFIETREAVSKGVAAGYEQAAESASSALSKQNIEMGKITDQINENFNKIKEYSKGVKEFAEVATLVGQSALAGVQGFANIEASLKSIATTNFDGLDKFDKVASLQGQMALISSDAEKIVANLSKEFPAEAMIPKGLVESLKQTFVLTAQQIAEETNKIKVETERTLSATPAKAAVEFPEAKASLQTALDANPPLKAKVDLVPNNSSMLGGGARGFAEGGPIRGPGTGTSDSILSWLSNGEYVNDARTTSFFGPEFFATLKRIARGGSSAATKLLTGFGGGLRLPAFAGGGLALSSLSGGGAGLASAFAQAAEGGDTVNVNLSLDGKTFSMRSGRDTANDLVRTIRNLSRST